MGQAVAAGSLDLDTAGPAILAILFDKVLQDMQGQTIAVEYTLVERKTLAGGLAFKRDTAEGTDGTFA